MFSIFLNAKLLAPVHHLTNSTLLGMQLWQSFVMVKVAYRALSPEPFTLLQKRVFPVYFQSQCALIVLSAITFPANGPTGLFKAGGNWIPHLVGAVTAALNLLVFGPRTSRLMMIRRARGTLAIGGAANFTLLKLPQKKSDTITQQRLKFKMKRTALLETFPATTP